MRLDRVHGHVQATRDLLVGHALGGQLDDSPLADGQLVVGTAPTADPAEFLGRALGPAGAAELVEDFPGPRERVAGGPALVGPALLVTQREQGAGLLVSQAEPLVAVRSARQTDRRLLLVLARQQQDGRAPPRRDAGPGVPLARREQAQPLGHRPGSLVLVALDERFHQVSGHWERTGLVDLLAQWVLPDDTEQISRLLRLARAEGGHPGRTRGLEPVPAESGRLARARSRSVPRRIVG